jgi:hypothetical protein
VLGYIGKVWGRAVVDVALDDRLEGVALAKAGADV